MLLQNANAISTGRKMKVPIYELLGGKVRSKVQVYAWIGGDRPADIEVAA
jgi:galactonate dehydratase